LRYSLLSYEQSQYAIPEVKRVLEIN